jgi:hypothetical protein
MMPSTNLKMRGAVYLAGTGAEWRFSTNLVLPPVIQISLPLREFNL